MTRQIKTWNFLEMVAFGLAIIISFIIYGGSSSAQENLPQLQITSPPDGAVVVPGETITVIVEPAMGMTFIQVIIIGEGPLGFSNEIATTAPFELSLTIPPDTSPGTYYFMASGAISPGVGAESDPISIIVERPDSPIKLQVEPSQIYFESVGKYIPLSVIGTFSDGSIMTLTDSTLTSFGSSDMSVAEVSPTGFVTAVGPGTATITVQYGDQSFGVRLLVPSIGNLSDLSVTKTHSPDPVTVGDDLIYTITVTNNGPDTAMEVGLIDTLPPLNTTFVSATSTQGSCNGTSTVFCDLGNLDTGATTTVSIIIKPTSAGEIASTAIVSGNEIDPEPLNNSATVDTRVNATSSDGGGCFIATAVYGSYLDPHVKVLRGFRDDYLLGNAHGQSFVAFYYQYSPPVADLIREHEPLRTATRWALTPVVFGIQYPSIPIYLMLLITGVLIYRRGKSVKPTYGQSSQ